MIRIFFSLFILIFPFFQAYSVDLSEIDNQLLAEIRLDDLQRLLLKEIKSEKSPVKEELELRIARIERVKGNTEKAISQYRALYKKIKNNEIFLDEEIKWLLTAETLAETMILEGVSSIIKNGSEVKTAAENVIAINPENKRARLILIESMINAPRLFGGNPQKALDEIDRLLEDETDVIIIFKGNLLKVSALLKLKKNTEAKRIISIPEKLFPSNSDLKKLKEKL